MASSGLDWKNNPIKTLSGAGGTDAPPTVSDWIKFEDGARRSCTAVGIEHIFTMLEALSKRADFIPLFEDMGAIPDPNGGMNYQQIEFQSAVVLFAYGCGKDFRFPAPGPGTSEEHTRRNCAELVKQLASFGLQIKNAAERHRAAVFIGNDKRIVDHPLRALIEYRKLELTFYPFKSVKPNIAWEDLNKAAMKTLYLDPEVIDAHMTEITVIRNQLLVNKSASEVDEMFVGTFIRQLQAVDGSDNDKDVRLWRSDAASWYKKFEENPEQMPWDVLVGEVQKALSRFKADGVGASGNKRPRMQISGPPGLAMYTYEEAYGMAMQAAEGAYLAAQGVCFNCGQPGHIRRDCPRPSTSQGPPMSRQAMRYGARGRGIGGAMRGNGRGAMGSGGAARGGRAFGGAAPMRGGRGAGGAYLANPGGVYPGPGGAYPGANPGGAFPGAGGAFPAMHANPGGAFPGAGGAYPAASSNANAYIAGAAGGGVQNSHLPRHEQKVFNKPFEQVVNAQAMYAAQHGQPAQYGIETEQHCNEDSMAGGYGQDQQQYGEQYDPTEDYDGCADGFAMAAYPGRSAELGEAVKAHAYFAFGGNFGLTDGMDREQLDPVS